jgi:single-strand DNA-binding protein
MTNEIKITTKGLVGTEPKFYPAKNENSSDFCSFRLANTQRYFDKKEGQWVDGETIWFTVKAFRGLARNIASSINKADPILVSGSLKNETYDVEGETKSSLTIEADMVGHDMSRGISAFTYQSATSDLKDYSSSSAKKAAKRGKSIENIISEAEIVEVGA